MFLVLTCIANVNLCVDVLLCLQCPDVHPVCVDLVDWRNTQSAVQSLGHIDLLVNNAGVGRLQAFVDVTADDFDWYVAVSSTGFYARPIIYAC